MDSTPKLYRHYKGDVYEMMGITTNAIFFRGGSHPFLFALHTEKLTQVRVTIVGNQMFANERLVIYKDKFGNVWARPYDMFYGLTDDGVKRFELI